MPDGEPDEAAAAPPAGDPPTGTGDPGVGGTAVPAGAGATLVAC